MTITTGRAKGPIIQGTAGKEKRGPIPGIRGGQMEHAEQIVRMAVIPVHSSGNGLPPRSNRPYDNSSRSSSHRPADRPAGGSFRKGTSGDDRPYPGRKYPEGKSWQRPFMTAGENVHG